MKMMGGFSGREVVWPAPLKTAGFEEFGLP
jgi:hypothetical protein